MAKERIEQQETELKEMRGEPIAGYIFWVWRYQRAEQESVLFAFGIFQSIHFGNVHSHLSFCCDWGDFFFPVIVIQKTNGKEQKRKAHQRIAVTITLMFWTTQTMT